MEFKQAVGDRRTIRYFKSWQPVEPEKIQVILGAARLRSQHGNAQLNIGWQQCPTRPS